jgi:hypothetical protein
MGFDSIGGSNGVAVTPQLADFRATFPELSNYTDAQVTMWITQATPFFNTDRWGDMLFLGMLYWAAHQLTVSNANATQQLVDDGLTKKVGDISKTRDTTLMNKQADNPYYRTYYGQQYLYYQQLVGVGGISV